MYLLLHEGTKREKWMKEKLGRYHRVGEDMFGHNGKNICYLIWTWWPRSLNLCIVLRATIGVLGWRLIGPRSQRYDCHSSITSSHYVLFPCLHHERERERDRERFIQWYSVNSKQNSKHKNSLHLLMIIFSFFISTVELLIYSSFVTFVILRLLFIK